MARNHGPQPLASASADIRSGKLRAWAVTTPTRSQTMSDLPAVAEAGNALDLARFDVSTWFGSFVEAERAKYGRVVKGSGVRAQ